MADAAVAISDVAHVRAILIAAAQQRQALSYAELLNALGHPFTRPRMRALCRTLDVIDDAARAAGQPELAVLVVRQSDGLPGQGWWVGRDAGGYMGRWTGQDAKVFVSAQQAEVFEFWAASSEIHPGDDRPSTRSTFLSYRKTATRPALAAIETNSGELQHMLELPPDAALLVIDVQQGFDDPRWGRRNNPGAERNVAQLLRAWREDSRPVLHVRHDSIMPESPLRPGQSGNGIKPEAAPVDGEPIYPKSVNSAFIGTSLEAHLRARGLTTLVVVGLTTNHCVSTTARMAGNLGFTTFVVSDATATFDRLALDGQLRPAAEVHAAALSDLDGEFASVVDTQAVLQGFERERT